MPSMRSFEDLGRRGEIARLRRVAAAMLDRYGVRARRLVVLRHEHNTTFRVDDGSRYVLRLNRPGVHDRRTIESEMAWLTALNRQTGLGVPRPVAARDGSTVVVESVPGVPEPRLGVLLRWQDGRFADRRLAPAHLEAVGVLLARLHDHAVRWTPPDEFARPRVDALTVQARRASISGPGGAELARVYPSPEDGRGAHALVQRLFSSAGASVFARGLRLVRRTMRELAELPEPVGLLHADLHYENFLFRGGEALAIDFDDCGWGPPLYDLAVPLSELADRPRYGALRDALLRGYERHRPLPRDHDVHLRALVILRHMQLLIWILESRDQAAFRDRWRPWARGLLDALAEALEAHRPGRPSA